MNQIVSTVISLALLISFVTGCSSSQKNYLEERAGYDLRTPPMLLPNEKNGKPVAYMPTRVPKRVVLAWLHGHELPSHDYFQGAWLSLLVNGETWEMKPIEIPKETKKVKPKSQTTAKKAI